MKINGSEKFTYLPNSNEVIRNKISGFVGLHRIAESESNSIDPLTYEVVRHRLVAITTEMGEALKRMSGSLIVAEANDFNTGIMNEVGDNVCVGLYNTQLTASMDLAVKWTLENRSDNPGISEGDMFLCNDPWIGGGLHQNDVMIMAPVFWEGQIFSWTCVVAHQLDLGGVSPGSLSVRSTDVFSESLPTPPIKLVENGVLRSDVEDIWVRRSRVPNFIGLDMRAMIGTNNVAHDRLVALIHKYGPKTIKAVMQKMMNDAENRLRHKLLSIPDGKKKGIAYVDHAKMGDRGVYKIEVEVTKRGGKLICDFTGTDRQVDGFINCTYSGLRGGVYTVILPLLCGDIPWSMGGIERCVEIITETGTINNCEFPSGVSKASVGAAWVTQNAVHECIAAIMDTSETTRHSLAALPMAPGATVLGGLDQRGMPYISLVVDSLAGGFGAGSNSDGVDTGGCLCLPLGRIADVEMTEFTTPILYLWRREECDTGGPGRYRGGLGGSSCFVLHDTPLKAAHLVHTSMGKAVPNAIGLSGGYPGSTEYEVILRNSDVRGKFIANGIPTEFTSISGTAEVVPPHYETTFHWDDVYLTQWQGGGGYGDPILRRSEDVLSDVNCGKVSRDAARMIYGIVINNGAVDESETALFRKELRKVRAGHLEGDL